MPRRQILSDIERNNLFAVPEDKDDLIRLYTLSERDFSLIGQYSRGMENRLGFAIQLCYMKFPGIILSPGAKAGPIDHIWPFKLRLAYITNQQAPNSGQRWSGPLVFPPFVESIHF